MAGIAPIAGVGHVMIDLPTATRWQSVPDEQHKTLLDSPHRSHVCHHAVGRSSVACGNAR
jgi:hypothetical protein